MPKVIILNENTIIDGKERVKGEVVSVPDSFDAKLVAGELQRIDIKEKDQPKKIKEKDVKAK